MPEESEVVVLDFQFNGETEWKPDQSNEQEVDQKEKEEHIVQRLTEQADEIAKELESESTSVFQRFAAGRVIVHAEVKFSQGTIVIEGIIIAMLTAMGTIATQAVSQALGQNLAALLQSRLNWFFNRRHQRTFGSDAGQVEPFDINVSVPRMQQHATVPTTSRPRFEETREFQAGEVATPSLQIWQQANPLPNTQGTSDTHGTPGAQWVIPAIAIGTAIAIVLLAVLLTIVVMQLS